MDSLIITTPEQLRQIVKECLDDFIPIPTPPQSSPVKYLYSINALSDFLNFSPVTAQKLKNSGKVRFSQFGRKCVFKADEILEDISKIQRR